MRGLALVVAGLAGCFGGNGQSQPPEPITCGSQTCGRNQLCGTITAGHVCDTNPDAGIGEYDVLGQACMDVPAECHGTPTCECIAGCTANGLSRPCLEVFDRGVSCGCF
jgi:hypothetical protein